MFIGRIHMMFGDYPLGFKWTLTNRTRTNIMNCSHLGQWNIFLKRKRRFRYFNPVSLWRGFPMPSQKLRIVKDVTVDVNALGAREPYRIELY